MKKLILLFGFIGCIGAFASDIHVCYVLDDGFSVPTQASLNSVLQNSDPSDNLNIHIVDFGISEKNKEKFESLKSVKNFELEFKKFDSAKFASFQNYGWSPLIYCKFFFQDIFPELNKLIFIDGDTIVEKSFSPVWNIDLTDKYLAGVDHGGFLVAQHKASYCDAFLLLNLEKFREENLGEKLMNDVIEHQKTEKMYTTEPAFQKICGDKAVTLPLRYNIHIRNIPLCPPPVKFQPSPNLIKLFYEMNDAVVWHYSSQFKPWKLPKEEFLKISPAFLWNEWWKYNVA